MASRVDQLPGHSLPLCSNAKALCSRRPPFHGGSTLGAVEGGPVLCLCLEISRSPRYLHKRRALPCFTMGTLGFSSNQQAPFVTMRLMEPIRNLFYAKAQSFFPNLFYFCGSIILLYASLLELTSVFFGGWGCGMRGGIRQYFLISEMLYNGWV